MGTFRPRQARPTRLACFPAARARTAAPGASARTAGRGPRAALDFYAGAFGAEELSRIGCPDGTVGHAESRLGDSRLMVAEENAAWGSAGPETLGGSPVSLVLYVPDVDAVFTKAVAAARR